MYSANPTLQSQQQAADTNPSTSTNTALNPANYQPATTEGYLTSLRPVNPNSSSASVSLPWGITPPIVPQNTNHLHTSMGTVNTPWFLRVNCPAEEVATESAAHNIAQPGMPGPVSQFWDTLGQAKNLNQSAQPSGCAVSDLLSHTNTATEGHADGTSSIATGCASNASGVVDERTLSSLVKRRRGRPKGSKNRKLPLSSTLTANPYAALFPGRQGRSNTSVDAQDDGRQRYGKRLKHQFNVLMNDLAQPRPPPPHPQYATATPAMVPAALPPHLAHLISIYGHLPPEALAELQQRESAMSQNLGHTVYYPNQARNHAENGAHMYMMPPNVPGADPRRPLPVRPPGTMQNMCNFPIPAFGAVAQHQNGRHLKPPPSLQPRLPPGHPFAGEQGAPPGAPFPFPVQGAQYVRPGTVILNPFVTRISQFERCALCGETGQNFTTAYVCARRTCQRLFCLKCIALSGSKPVVTVFNEQIHECIVCIYQSRKRSLGDPNQWHFEFKDVNDGHFVRMLRDMLPLANGLFIEISKTRQPCWRRKLRNKARKHFSFRFYGGIFESRLEALEIGRTNSARLAAMGQQQGNQALPPLNQTPEQHQMMSCPTPGYMLPPAQISSSSPAPPLIGKVAPIPDDSVILQNFNVANGVPFVENGDYVAISMGRVGLGSMPSETEMDGHNRVSGLTDDDCKPWSPSKTPSLRITPAGSPPRQGGFQASPSPMFRAAGYESDQQQPSMNLRTPPAATVAVFECCNGPAASSSLLEEHNTTHRPNGFLPTVPTASLSPHGTPERSAMSQLGWGVDAQNKECHTEILEAPGLNATYETSLYCSPANPCSGKRSRDDTAADTPSRKQRTSESFWLTPPRNLGTPQEGNNESMEKTELLTRRPSFSAELVGDPVLPVVSHPPSPSPYAAAASLTPQLSTMCPNGTPGMVERLGSAEAPIPSNLADPGPLYYGAPHPVDTVAAAVAQHQENYQALAASYDQHPYDGYYVAENGSLHLPGENLTQAIPGESTASKHYATSAAALYNHPQTQPEKTLMELAAYYSAPEGQDTASSVAMLKTGPPSIVTSQLAHPSQSSEQRQLGVEFSQQYHQAHHTSLEHRAPPQHLLPPISEAADISLRLHRASAYAFPDAGELHSTAEEGAKQQLQHMLYYASEHETNNVCQQPTTSQTVYTPLLDLQSNTTKGIGAFRDGVTATEQNTAGLLGDSSVLVLGQQPTAHHHHSHLSGIPSSSNACLSSPLAQRPDFRGTAAVYSESRDDEPSPLCSLESTFCPTMPFLGRFEDSSEVMECGVPPLQYQPVGEEQEKRGDFNDENSSFFPDSSSYSDHDQQPYTPHALQQLSM